MMLVTGATGLVGSCVAEQARRRGLAVRALVRPVSAERNWLEGIGVELKYGELDDRPSLEAAVNGAAIVVHCAARVGDWGTQPAYTRDNVEAVGRVLDVVSAAHGLKRFVYLSSLGVYEPRDHFGTDESTPAWRDGFDPYTRSKAEAEGLVVEAIAAKRVPGVVLRPGFVYGARDRRVIPGIVQSLRAKRFAFLGSGEQRLDTIYVKNLAEAVLLATEVPQALGEVFNLTDDPPATRREFVATLARHAGLDVPDFHLPLWLARPLAITMDRTSRAFGAKTPPLLSMARYKFMALNLDFSIEKAKRVLGYQPAYGLEDGMRESVAWFREQGLL